MTIKPAHTVTVEGITYTVDLRGEQFCASEQEGIPFDSLRGKEVYQLWLAQRLEKALERNAGVKEGDPLIVVEDVWTYHSWEHGERPDLVCGQQIWFFAPVPRTSATTGHQILIALSREDLDRRHFYHYILSWTHFAPVDWWKEQQASMSKGHDPLQSPLLLEAEAAPQRVDEEDWDEEEVGDDEDSWDDEREEEDQLSPEQQIALARQTQAHLSEEWLASEFGSQHGVILDALQEYIERREQQGQERCAECGGLADHQVWLCVSHAGVLPEVEAEILAYLKGQEGKAGYPQVILERADGMRCRLMKEFQSPSSVDTTPFHWEYRELLPDNMHFAPGTLQAYQDVKEAVRVALAHKFYTIVKF